jgi:hypothetical protein
MLPTGAMNRHSERSAIPVPQQRERYDHHVRRRQESGVWWASPHVAAFIALMPTVLAVFLIAHELTLHDVVGGVTFPAAGVNFASALAL